MTDPESLRLRPDRAVRANLEEQAGVKRCTPEELAELDGGYRIVGGIDSPEPAEETQD